MTMPDETTFVPDGVLLIMIGVGALLVIAIAAATQ
jgi:hypothetical protein